MPASPEELTAARSWIGTTETDSVFEERVDRLGSLGRAIEESLRSQLSAMVLDQPAGLGLPDGTNLNYAANIKALTEQYERFLLSDIWLAVIGGEETKAVNITQIQRLNVR